MSSEARQVTREELISLLENVKEEVLSGKVKVLQATYQNLIFTESPSPYIVTSSLSGKQFIISVLYEEYFKHTEGHNG